MRDTSKKREEKGRGKFYFVRIREEYYMKIAKLADKEERSTNSMVNRLIEQQLKDLEISKSL